MKNDSELSITINSFAKGADDLSLLVEGIAGEDLDKKLSSGEWSIRQIIHHLADDGDVYSFIIKRAIATPDTRIVMEGFPGNEVWSNALGNDYRPVTSALDLIRAHRSTICELIQANPNSINQEVRFMGDDGKEIKFNVKQMIEMLTEHFAEHLETILKIKQKFSL